MYTQGLGLPLACSHDGWTSPGWGSWTLGSRRLRALGWSLGSGPLEAWPSMGCPGPLGGGGCRFDDTL